MSETVPLIDIPALAQRLGISVHHVRRLVTERRIPFMKIGHLVRFEIRDVEQWMNERRVEAQPSRGRRG